MSGELRHKLSEIESNAMERNRQMDRNMDEMRTQLDMTGRLNARLQVRLSFGPPPLVTGRERVDIR